MFLATRAKQNVCLNILLPFYKQGNRNLLITGGHLLVLDLFIFSLSLFHWCITKIGFSLGYWHGHGLWGNIDFFLDKRQCSKPKHTTWPLWYEVNSYILEIENSEIGIFCHLVSWIFEQNRHFQQQNWKFEKKSPHLDTFFSLGADVAMFQLFVVFSTNFGFVLIHITRDDEMMKNWVDFVKIKFHKYWMHCMQLKSIQNL